MNVNVSFVTTNGAGTAPVVDNAGARKEPATPDDGVARENEVLRGENEELKGNVVGMLAAVASKVEAEYFRYILAVMAAGSVVRAAQALEMANSTLDRRLKAYAARGETYRRLYDLVVVRQKLGVRSFERFNEEFAKHQPAELQEESVLQSVLEGLENLNGANLESVKKELMGMLKAAGL